MKIESLDVLRDLCGREIGVTDWVLISQDMIDAFADVTGDRQWIHIDSDRARMESPYGGTIAHGFLTLALSARFLGEVIEIAGPRMVVNYGLNRVRFPAAVRVSTRVRARVSLISTKDIPEGVEATYLISIEAERSDKPCCVAELLLRYLR